MSFYKRISCLVLFAFLSVSCSGSGDGMDDDMFDPTKAQVTAAVKRALSTPSTNQLQQAANFILDRSSQIEVTSLLSPITLITLNGTVTEEIYRCDPATDADACKVELVGSDLGNLIDSSAIEIEPGTYETITVGQCFGSGFTANLTASAELDSVTYYTKSDGTVSSTAPAESVELDFSGCGTEYDLPEPLVVAEGDRITLNLFFDARAAAFMGLASEIGITNADCAGLTSPAFACLGYTDVVPTVSSDVSIERYVINDTSIFGFFFDENDAFIGGYARKYFVDGVDFTDFDIAAASNPIEEFTDNGDGTYSVRSTDDFFVTSDFERQSVGDSHTGTAADEVPTMFTYTAVRKD